MDDPTWQSTMGAKVLAAASAIDDDLVALRRTIHMQPELGWCEFRTTAELLGRLERHADTVRLHWGRGLGVEQRPGAYPEQQDAAASRAREAGVDIGLIRELRRHGTGLVCEIGDADADFVVALRFDIDALPVQESREATHPPRALGFRSQIDGVSHACGHDAHTAIGLGVVTVLADMAAVIPAGAAVRVIFQPAEEGTRGATPLVSAGWLRGARAFFAPHVDNTLPLGMVCPGVTAMWGTTKFDVHVTGRASHANESPELGIDALAAAIEIYGRLARHGGQGSTDRVTCNVLAGGSTRNVVADAARMECEVRSRSSDGRRRLNDYVHKVADDVARRSGAPVEVVEVGGSPPGDSNAAGREIVSAAIARNHLGNSGVRSFEASDDAAVMMAEVSPRPASYLLLGAGGTGDAHSAGFDVDEKVLGIGTRLLTDVALHVIAGDMSNAGS